MTQLAWVAIIVQIIGVGAMITEILSVQPKFRTSMLWLRVISNVLWTIHFSLLGAWAGALMNGIGTVRSYTFNTYGAKKDRNPLLLYIILAAEIAGAFIVFDNLYGLLAVAGMIVATIGLWQLDTQRLRLVMLVSAVPWFIYDMLVGSIPGMIDEVLASISSMIALYRYRQKNEITQSISTESKVLKPQPEQSN
ncbi:MAG TPA: YgjV family protein [Candidatus Saccharimonadales bacterium]|nr:YgjV family protein [Candidatus Saccharimonadales bacterium]